MNNTNSLTNFIALHYSPKVWKSLPAFPPSPSFFLPSAPPSLLSSFSLFSHFFLFFSFSPTNPTTFSSLSHHPPLPFLSFQTGIKLQSLIDSHHSIPLV